MSATKLTPLMQQYWDVKAAHEDKVLLFRMGDFFEMFHRDAEIAAPILGIALTSRNKKALDETPMCGVPHHSIGNQINKLLAAGYKVAICDQIEDPKFAKGLVKRAVTRILTPGVVYDPETLDARRANYLASFDEAGALSFLDASTGEAFFFRVRTNAAIDRLLLSLQPAEVVLSAEQASVFSLARQSDKDDSSADSARRSSGSSVVTAYELDDLNSRDLPEGIASAPLSARRLFAYVRKLQGPGVAKQVLEFERREAHDRLHLGANALRHLEVFETYRGETQGSLFFAIDRCKTSAGSRTLRQWLQFPLAEPQAIERRQDEIERWLSDQATLKDLRRALSQMGDVARRISKLASPSCHPRDLLALASALEAGLLASGFAPHMAFDQGVLESCRVAAAEIRAVLLEDPPAQIRQGGLIRKGASAELDELIDLAENSSRLIHELEIREREATGIGSLKVRFNGVFGYYIEITHAHKDKVPESRYLRKQTLANAERYSTPELEELERKTLSAAALRSETELAIFDRLKNKALSQSGIWLKAARAWAELDVLSSLASLAIERAYVRPSFSKEGHLHLEKSRHPVVEQTSKLPFIANDLDLEPSSCLLLTGPNMAGKSTLMRQVAAIAIMAQAGSFVPARKAELPIFDRIFTRIGASDSLSEGLSTFMVEMTETSLMLSEASKQSLVILDEVGRGTSTYDGMSLAQAILERLLTHSKSTTLFATHYHELTTLDLAFPQLKNGHMAIHENAGEITFLHRLRPGPANKSYGIHVARLAGLPPAVVKRASEILRGLEASGARASQSPQLSLLLTENLPENLPEDVDSAESVSDDVFADSDRRQPGRGARLSATPEPRFEDEQATRLKQELKSLDVSALTPLDALNRLAQWQQSLF